MPSKEFLEEYPLYRKYKAAAPKTVGTIPFPPIHMYCDGCRSDQTFTRPTYPSVGGNALNEVAGTLVEANYYCSACNGLRHFMLYFDPDGHSVRKIGQWPPWDVAIDKELEKALGDLAAFFRSGLKCESQGYGIGAFAYYRRVLEGVIGTLLDDIGELADDSQRGEYMQALEKVRSTSVTRDKIDFVKDLLPSILRPDGFNSLKILHGALSEGLHEESEEVCLQHAASIRESLVFLVGRVSSVRAARNSFALNMKKLAKGKQ